MVGYCDLQPIKNFIGGLMGYGFYQDATGKFKLDLSFDFISYKDQNLISANAFSDIHFPTYD